MDETIKHNEGGNWTKIMWS